MNISFGKYPIKTEEKEGRKYIYDPIRHKWVILTPEEQVRQIWLQYLIVDKRISPSKIAVEKGLYLNDRKKRFDICVYDELATPYLLIECKAPTMPLHLSVLEQLGLYNSAIGARMLIISNGVEHKGIQLINEQVQPMNTF